MSQANSEQQYLSYIKRWSAFGDQNRLSSFNLLCQDKPEDSGEQTCKIRRRKAFQRKLSHATISLNH